MKAMILAAGLGTRLRPLTDTTPKPLLPLNGQPLILYAIQLLKKYGITDILINLHHLGDLIEKELGDGQKWGVRIRYSWEPEVLGTGGGVKKGESFFGSESFLVINSDILINLNLTGLLHFHQRRGALATMVVRPYEPSYTPVFLDEQERIRTIGENIADSKSRQVMYTGLQILNPAFLKYLPEGSSCLIQQGYLPAIAKGETVSGYLYEGYWSDVGTQDRFRQAEKDIADGLFK